MPKLTHEEIVRRHMSTIGERGGRAKSARKAAAARANGAKRKKLQDEAGQVIVK